MKTSNTLSQSTVKELAALARKLDIAGWHEMRKTDLVKAILAKKQTLARKVAAKRTDSLAAPKNNSKQSVPSRPSAKPSARPPVQAAKATKVVKTTKAPPTKPIPTKPTPAKNSKSVALTAAKTTDSAKSSPQEMNPKISELHEKLNKLRGISGIYDDHSGANQDRLVLLVRGPFWLHVYWELCSRSIERAKAAMGYSWHTAVPVLRIFRIVADGMNNPRRDIVRDIRIHSEVNNWYVDVQDPPGTFQVEIGFLSREKNFFSIASSNIVQTPQNQVVSGTTKVDEHWTSIGEDFDRIYTLSGGKEKKGSGLKDVFEVQLGRSMSLPVISRFGTGNVNYEKTKRHFSFTVNADIIIHGQTDPSVQVSIRGEPIQVANDGSFAVQYSLAEKRHVYPVEAKGSDGIETQQVILAIDRNTKILETVFLENDEED